jgi:uncharacterized protein YyaL (SSP411 family)
MSIHEKLAALQEAQDALDHAQRLAETYSPTYARHSYAHTSLAAAAAMGLDPSLQTGLAASELRSLTGMTTPRDALHARLADSFSPSALSSLRESMERAEQDHTTHDRPAHMTIALWGPLAFRTE